jgi:hypothetical protein
MPRRQRSPMREPRNFYINNCSDDRLCVPKTSSGLIK